MAGSGPSGSGRSCSATCAVHWQRRLVSGGLTNTPAQDLQEGATGEWAGARGRSASVVRQDAINEHAWQPDRSGREQRRPAPCTRHTLA